jgi:7-cyano-7-deazaguanine synthase
MKSVVLLSAGLDSTVNFLEALKQGTVELVLTFDYGQRAAKKEIEKAQNLCEKYKVRHQILELPFFKMWGRSSLVDNQMILPTAGHVNIESQEQSLKTAKSVWVPNRNGIFLNIAAGFAETLGADTVVPGFNLEEASTFPDNSEDFVQVMTQSLSFSTQNQVQVRCFTIHLDKNQIVKKGIELGLDWNLIWPCYQSQDRWCGQCESCLRSKRAFFNNQISWLGN